MAEACVCGRRQMLSQMASARKQMQLEMLCTETAENSYNVRLVPCKKVFDSNLEECATRFDSSEGL